LKNKFKNAQLFCVFQFFNLYVGFQRMWNKTALRFLKPFQNLMTSQNETMGYGLFSLKQIKNKKQIDLQNFLKEKYIIIGVPDGRNFLTQTQNPPHSHHGPLFFRRAFYNLYDTQLRSFHLSTHRPCVQPDSTVRQHPHAFLSHQFFDAGNIIFAKSVEETQERLASVVEFFLGFQPKMIFVIGGSQDVTYGSYKGHVAQHKTHILPLLNWDAYLDFYAAQAGDLEKNSFLKTLTNDFNTPLAQGKAFLKLGLQRDANPPSFYQWAQKNNIQIIEYVPLQKVWRNLAQGNAQLPLEHIRDHLDSCASFGFDRLTGSVHGTFNLNVLHQAVAPGASASTPLGSFLEDFAQAIGFLGKSFFCRVLDIVELCPPRDNLDMTSRLCASLVYRLAILREEYSNR
jgi:formiminoglutamase